MPDLIASTPTERRISAATDLHEARKLTRRAGKSLDGLTPTERHNCTMALTALTDALDAIVAADPPDLSEGERGLRSFCEERGIQEPSL